MKPYYESGGITIYNADCRDVLPTLSGVDLVLTDPPYGMGKADWDSLIDPSTWLPIARSLATVVALFPGVKGMYDYPKPDWVMSWVRLGSTQRNGAMKGFSNWEPILLYGKLSLSNDVVSCPNFPDPEAREHPTPKPLKLMKALLGRLPGSCVVDCFMGSGTTIRAAKDCGLKAIGIEREERYCELAVKRMAQEVLF